MTTYILIDDGGKRLGIATGEGGEPAAAAMAQAQADERGSSVWYTAEDDGEPIEIKPVERPRLVSRPLPEGWAPDKPGMMRPPGHYHAALRHYCARWEWEYTARAKAMAVLALVDWLDHEAAVKAQDKVKP